MEKRKYVYIGRRLNTKNKLSHFYKSLDDPEDGIGYKKKLIGYEPVGGIVEITMAEDGNTFFVAGDNAPQYIGKVEDRDEEIQFWLSEEKADVILDEQAKLARSDSRTDELDDLIEPLRVLVSKQVGYGRKAALIKYIEQRLYS